jgi:hypothetical protein
MPAPASAAETIPMPVPAAERVPMPVPVPVPAIDLPAPAGVGRPDAGQAEAPRIAVALPETPPPPTVEPGAPAAGAPRGRFGTDTLIPERPEPPPSTLSPELQRAVERVAQRQEEEMRQRGAVPPSDLTAAPETPTAPGGPTSTRLEISRAPSPTEARPIRAIPVPEEFVPLPKREWDPNRKYWAAAATCHLPLYFQDAALERYGYSAEQHFGPLGRYLSIPLDDPRQSKQRNQIAQPFFSIGLFAAQVVLLPYNMIMDPPWEAEYDLGYYRPGDRVPTDVYYLPLTGIGPPLRGSNYGNPPPQGATLPPSRW